MTTYNLQKNKIKYPKYLLLKAQKNLTCWTLWIFGPNQSAKKKIKVFSVLITLDELTLFYKQKSFLYKTHFCLLESIFLGFAKKYNQPLELYGVGYTVNLSNNNIVLNLGFSHKVIYKLPSFIFTNLDKKKIQISGSNFHRVTQFANILRNLKIPEPYKGKGIKFLDEVVVLKESKKSN